MIFKALSNFLSQIKELFGFLSLVKEFGGRKKVKSQIFTVFSLHQLLLIKFGLFFKVEYFHNCLFFCFK